MKKLLLATTALVAAALPAHADPVSAIVGVFTSVGIGTATAVALTQIVIGLGASIIGQAIFGKPSIPGPDVKFDVRFGDNEPLSFTVGEFATAGKMRYVGSWGRNNRFVTRVIEVSSVPQGLSGVWVDDERGVFIDGQRGTIAEIDSRDDLESPDRRAAGSIPAGRLDIGTPLTNYEDDPSPITERMWVKWVDGTQTAADPFLVWAFADDPDYPWTSEFVGAGKSYAIVTSRYDSDTNTGLPVMLFEPEPLALYDLRLDSTNGGSGPQRWNDPSTWQPTVNPAVIAYNIIRGIYHDGEWVFGGKNLDPWRLPSAEWIAAANECDDPVSLAAGGTEPRYRCGLEIDVDKPAADYLEELSKAANMRFAEVGGRMKVICGLPIAPAFSFTDDDVIVTEGQSFKPFFPISETYNAISASYPSPREKWAARDAPEYIDADAMADDGQYLPTSMNYAAVPFFRQVNRLKRAQLRDYRRMRRHQFYLPPDAYALEPLVDVVSWTSERNGYDGKWFEVESVATTPGMNVLVSLREIDPSDYDWSSSFEVPETITVPKRPVRFIQPIRGLAVSGELILDADGVGRRPAILVACDGSEVGVTDIQMQARVVGRDTTIDVTRRFGGDFAWYLTNVLPDTGYEVRARLLSELTPRSQWSPWLSVTTPDSRLGPLDLEMAAIQAEVTADLSELEDWRDETGDYLREIRDELDAARDLSAELGAQAQLQRGEIRRELAVEMGNVRASFDERIDVLATADTAISAAITALEARVGDDSTATANQSLITRVTTVEGDITAQSDAITQVDARVGRISGSGLLRVSSVAAPTGAESRVALSAEASAGDTSHSAALFLVASTDGTSQAIVSADRFAIATGQGANAAKLVPFVVDGGTVYIDSAFIRDAAITNAKMANAAIDTANIANLAVGRIKIADGAVTEFPYSFSGGDITLTPQNQWVNIQTVVFNRGRPDPLPLFLQVQQATTGGATQYRLRRNGATVWLSEDLTQNPDQYFYLTFVDSTTSTGSVTYRLDARCRPPTNTGYLRNRFLGGLNAFK